MALALANPDLTYHFAPPVAAVGWPIARRTTGGALPIRRGLLVSGASFAVAIGTLAILHLADALEGPTFWSDGGALWEGLAFSTVAALWGLRVLTRSRAGFLFG